MKLYDPRRPGAKVKTNPTMYGQEARWAEPAGLPAGSCRLISSSGPPGRQPGIAPQLRQMPGADTIRSYYEAQTPRRSEGRMIEAYAGHRRDVEGQHVPVIKARSADAAGRGGPDAGGLRLRSGESRPCDGERCPRDTPNSTPRSPRAAGAVLPQDADVPVAPNSALWRWTPSERKKPPTLAAREGHCDSRTSSKP